MSVDCVQPFASPSSTNQIMNGGGGGGGGCGPNSSSNTHTLNNTNPNNNIANSNASNCGGMLGVGGAPNNLNTVSSASGNSTGSGGCGGSITTNLINININNAGTITAVAAGETHQVPAGVAGQQSMMANGKGGGTTYK